MSIGNNTTAKMLVSPLNVIVKDGLLVTDRGEVPVQVFISLQRFSLMITMFVLIRLFELKLPSSQGFVIVAL